MNIQVKNIENLPHRNKVTLLKAMISNAFLWWFKGTMQELGIDGRTRLYQAFSWSGTWNRDQDTFETGDRKAEAAERILEQSTISTWTDRYLKHFTLAQFKNLYTDAIPHDVDQIDVRVEMNS